MSEVLENKKQDEGQNAATIADGVARGGDSDAIREELAKRMKEGGDNTGSEKPENERGDGDSTTESDKDSDEDSEQTDSLATGETGTAPPPMPPKEMDTAGFVVPTDTKEKYMWFRILEPRETRGFDGPYNEEDLRQMYKKGEINDETMLWAEGRRDWEQLLYMDDLRPRLIQVPLIPVRISKGKTLENEAFNPILTAPHKDDVSGAKRGSPCLSSRRPWT